MKILSWLGKRKKYLVLVLVVVLIAWLLTPVEFSATHNDKFRNPDASDSSADVSITGSYMVYDENGDSLVTNQLSIIRLNMLTLDWSDANDVVISAIAFFWTITATGREVDWDTITTSIVLEYEAIDGMSGTVIVPLTEWGTLNYMSSDYSIAGIVATNFDGVVYYFADFPVTEEMLNQVTYTYVEFHFYVHFVATVIDDYGRTLTADSTLKKDDFVVKFTGPSFTLDSTLTEPDWEDVTA